MAKTKSFEENMQELETIVSALENGDIKLEESLKLFEQGIKLAKSCQAMLDKASQKVTVLLREGEEFTEEEMQKTEE